MEGRHHGDLAKGILFRLASDPCMHRMSPSLAVVVQLLGFQLTVEGSHALGKDSFELSTWRRKALIPLFSATKCPFVCYIIVKVHSRPSGSAAPCWFPSWGFSDSWTRAVKKN
ncbi:hypothetical protein MUK42_11739 [Musa troglodytarum]|uniref:Uncharacterized protein n=1 Tax=Musa troglodytarum TaxID=320322 RepID=A0A9E7FTZ9_9LILI|nr:hypothetical protein MUK42_11739 [Musa troglodytarum]